MDNCHKRRKLGSRRPEGECISKFGVKCTELKYGWYTFQIKSILSLVVFPGLEYFGYKITLLSHLYTYLHLFCPFPISLSNLTPPR